MGTLSARLRAAAIALLGFTTTAAIAAEPVHGVTDTEI